MNTIYGITVELDRTVRASRVNRLRPGHSEPEQSRGRAASVKQSRPDNVKSSGYPQFPIWPCFVTILLRSSYTMRTKCAISDAFIRDCVFANCASVAQYVYSLSAEHCFRLRNNAISDERVRDCALSTHSVFRPLGSTAFQGYFVACYWKKSEKEKLNLNACGNRTLIYDATQPIIRYWLNSGSNNLSVALRNSGICLFLNCEFCTLTGFFWRLNSGSTHLSQIESNLTQRFSMFYSQSWLTRAPLGYFYNAPHWGGRLFRAPSDLRNYWTDSKISSGIWKPWKNCRRKTNFSWPRGHQWRHRSGQSKNVWHFGLGDIGV